MNCKNCKKEVIDGSLCNICENVFCLDCVQKKEGELICNVCIKEADEYWEQYKNERFIWR